MTPFEPIIIPPDPALKEIEQATKIANEYRITEDRFTPKEFTRAKSPRFINMKSGFGKLMKHFSGKK